MRIAESGQGHAVVLRGHAGMGKTGLLAAALRRCAAPGRTVLTTRCAQMSENVAYGAVRELFAPLGLAAGENSELLVGNARLALPALVADPAHGTPAADSYSVQCGLYWLAATLATDGLLVLALDDTHWCDESSWRWLGFLLRRAENMRLLLVLTRCGDAAGPADQAVAEIEAAGRTETIDVGPLPLDAVSDLIATSLAVPPGEAFARRCAEETGGNPMLLERLLGELRQRQAESRRPLSSVVGAGRAALARSVLDRLPVSTRGIAVAIAVLGNAEPAMVAGLSGLSQRAVAAGIEVLRGNAILLPDRVEIGHDRVRNDVLGTLPAARLLRLRTRAATLLSDAGRPAEEVAAQLLLLPRIDEQWMAGILREAARNALNRGAPSTAAHYLRRALVVDPRDTAVLTELATALAQNDPAEALRLLEHALTIVDGPRERALVAIQFGMVSLAAHDAPRAAVLLGGVLDELDAELGGSPTAADAALRTRVESALLITGLDEKATVRATVTRMRARPVPAGDTPGECQLLAMHAVVAALRGDDSVAAVANARRAIRVDGTTLGGWAVLASSLALYLADEVDAAGTSLTRLLDAAQSGGAAWTYTLGLGTRALFWCWCGNLAEAAADAETAFDITRQERWGATATMPRTAWATVLTQQGQAARAEELLAGITRPRFERFTLEYHWFLLARARTRSALGDHEGALSLLRACGVSLAEADIGSAVLAPWWLDGACLLAELGRPAEGAALAEQGAELAARWGTPRAIGMSLLARGVVAGKDHGVGLLAEAAHTLADTPARLEYARAEYLLGRALLRREDRKGAREHARKAIDHCARNGDWLLLDAARRVLVDAGGRMRPGARMPFDTLSGSERRVAALAAEGATNRSIAESLFVTVRTVEMHLTSVYRKLDVHGRGELAAALARR